MYHLKIVKNCINWAIWDPIYQKMAISLKKYISDTFYWFHKQITVKFGGKNRFLDQKIPTHCDGRNFCILDPKNPKLCSFYEFECQLLTQFKKN